MNDSSDEELHYGVPQLYRYIQTEASKRYFNSSTSIARSQQNIRLNRYNNVAPYDEHRVVLEDYKGNDYINASIAKSSADSPDQVYILAQGPLARTVFDFWRMGWERNVKSIVMLNKLIEQNRSKCDRYWPVDSKNSETYRNQNDPNQNELYFVVTLKEVSEDVPWYVVRDLEVSRYENETLVETRLFKHFHYVAWPDFGVPETPTEFAAFFDILQHHDCFSDPKSPSIVHCSAGIGRTGTLILVDSLLKKLRREAVNKVETHDIVQIATQELLTLRQYRSGLIQTADQLDFSMKAITHIHNRNVHAKSVNKTPEEDMKVDKVDLKTSPDPAAAADATPQLCKRRTPAPSSSPNTSSDDLRPPESEPPAEPATPVKPCDPKDLDEMTRREMIAAMREKQKMAEWKKERWNTIKLPLFVVGCVAIGSGLLYYFRPELFTGYSSTSTSARLNEL